MHQFLRQTLLRYTVHNTVSHVGHSHEELYFIGKQSVLMSFIIISTPRGGEAIETLEGLKKKLGLSS